MTHCPSVRRYSELSQGATAAEANAYALSLYESYERLPVGPTGLEPSKAWIQLNLSISPAVVSRLIVASWKRGTYNFQNLQNDDDLSKPTIEFRQAAGTLNEEWVRHWSAIVAATVNWARHATDDQIREFVLMCEFKEAFPNEHPVDALLRGRFQIPDAADYIARTTADTRATPRIEGLQKRWRAAPLVAQMFGPAMLPKDDWP